MTSATLTPLIIILLIIGIIFIIVSCFLMNKSESNSIDTELLSENLLKNTVVKKKVEEQLIEVTDETINRTEDELSKISNEKIIAVNDFSNTVLDKISNNHEEVVFLYQMLNEKEVEIKKLVSEIKNISKQTNDDSKVIENDTIKASQNKLESSLSHSMELLESDFEYLENDDMVKEPDENVNIQNGMNQNQRIIHMSEQGMSVVEIAKELRLGQGEVKLILDLYRHEIK